MKPKRECPLCQNNDVEKIYHINYIGNKNINGLPELVDIVICNNCSLVYNDFESSQDEFDKYYEKCSSYGQHFNKKLVMKFEYYYNDIVSFLDKYIKKEYSILDIGCGDGILLECFYNRGYKNISGIDQSNSFNNNKYNINFINGSIFLNDYIFNKQFNVITIVSVMEHIFDLNSIIENINKALMENGILYIDVPYIKLYNNRYNLSIEHINHFSKRSVYNLAVKYGFNILEYKISNFADGHHLQVILSKNKISNNKLLFEDSNKEIINNYIKFIENINNNINIDLINNLYNLKTKVILWGIAGTILDILPLLKKLNIISIVDSSTRKHNLKILDMNIIYPNEIEDEDATILILPELYYENIYNQIKEMGLKNKIEFLTRPDQTRPDQTRPDQTRPILICKEYIYSNNIRIIKKLQPMLAA